MRVKRGVAAHAKHKKILQAAKGMQHYRRRSFKLGKQGVIKALQYSYRDRRSRKRDFRALWITRINNASRELGVSYSQLIAGMKKNNINLIEIWESDYNSDINNVNKILSESINYKK